MKKNITLCFFASSILFAFSGCASKNSQVLTNYLKTKESNHTMKLKNTSIIDDYLEKKTVKPIDFVMVNKNDSLKKVIEDLVKFSNPEYKYILDIKKDYKFKKNINIKFKDVTTFFRYLELKKDLPFSISVVTNYKYKNIKVEYPNYYIKKLKNIHVNASRTISTLALIRDSIEQVKGLSLRVDQTTLETLDSTTPEAFNGSAYTFLNTVAFRNNLFLDIKDGYAAFSEVKTKIFPIFVTPLMINTSSSASISGSDASATQSSRIDFGYKIYEELQNNIKVIIGSRGGFFLNRASGQLTVKGRRDDLEVVSQIVSQFNDIYSKQVEINIEILEVSLNEEHNNGIDLNLLRKGSFSLGFASPEYDVSGTPTSKITYQNGDANGVIKAMNIFGTVSVVSKPKIVTLNSIPSVLDVGLVKEYISKISSTAATTTSPASYQTEKDEAKDGIKLFVYPRIVDNNKIILTLSPTITSIVGIDSVNVGATTVSNKTINNKTFNNTLIVKEGETTLLAGLLTSYKKKSKDVLPWSNEKDSFIDYVGGTKQTQKTKSELVLAISATITNLK